MLTTYFFIGLTLCFNVLGNVLLKIGVSKMKAPDTGLSPILFLTQLNGTLVLGAMSFGMGLVFYILVLSRVPLNLAQTVFSLQFISVILMAGLVLGEPISAIRWLGIGVIFIGLFIVGYSASE